jgi:hypothetical protein
MGYMVCFSEDVVPLEAWDHKVCEAKTAVPLEKIEK